MKIYYVRGLGFHNGFLSIKDNKRVWGMEKQLFSEQEISHIQIPQYIAYEIKTIDGITVYRNE